MKSKKNKKFDRIIFTEDKLRIINHYKGEGFLNIKVKKYSFSGDGEFIDIEGPGVLITDSRTIELLEILEGGEKANDKKESSNKKRGRRKTNNT